MKAGRLRVARMALAHTCRSSLNILTRERDKSDAKACASLVTLVSSLANLDSNSLLLRPLSGEHSRRRIQQGNIPRGAGRFVEGRVCAAFAKIKTTCSLGMESGTYW